MFHIKRPLITRLAGLKNHGKVRLCRGAYTDMQTVYEGMNSVGADASVTASYLGYATYIADKANISYAKIGRFSCIGPYVRIICGQHPTSFVSLHPAFYSLAGQHRFTYVDKTKYTDYRYVSGAFHVRIGNDVWIGEGASIMEGVTIGDGAIIAAGAVVVKDVAPYTIVGGVPAKKIRDRFEEDIVKKLLALSWWDKKLSWIREHAELFDNIDRFFNQIDREEERS